ncbi:phage major capsid protein [Nonomuraea sp. SYSU D8015]|uniref:phage major capsid protein n=1 Tax=Nonomuraea sp. SYSU D8015 TaxID=2593644 RepID=UPI001660E789|nr:phage major capsid protein [Nonomuraea sp. SYSU D8015]
MNPYLKRLREQYSSIQSSIEGLQTRAAEEGRDLTEDELRSVTEQGETAKKLYSQIEDLTEIETRNRKVSDLAARVPDNRDANGGPAVQNRALGIKAQERDPGHYRSEKDGGRHSFFGDLYRSRTHQDEEATRRLTEHQRALTTGSHGPGVVPPKWLTEEFELLARQGRRLASAVRNIPLGDDPRPITLPKQIAGTDAVVAEQVAENNAVGGADAWDSDVDVVTPKPTAGKQTVSRQMIDMSSPAIDQLIYGDLLDVYDDKLEAKIGSALITAAGAPVTTFALEASNWTPASAVLNSVVDAAIAVRNARKRPADILAMNVTRYGKFLKLRDADGRPLIVNPGVGQAVNVAGVGSVATDGIIEGLAVIATDGIPTAYPESYVAFRAADTVLFESNTLRFRFEEVAGPESVVLGIWGYTAVIVRQAGKSAKRVQITAA